MGKASLILVLSSIVLFSIYNTNINDSIHLGSKATIERYSEIQAKQTANSIVNIVLTEIAENASYRVTYATEKTLFGTTAKYRVIDTVLNVADTVVKIEVKALFETSFDEDKYFTVTAFTTSPKGWVPPFIRGAWTANADLNNTISDMYIDGRDYNLDLTINPGQGTYAVSSSTGFTNVDGAEIGGTTVGDVDVSFTTDPNVWGDVIEQNAAWLGSFPTTPDEILGYPEGTLIAIAQSGVNGSQYVLDPGSKIDSDDLNFPLTGVTYVEITDGIEGKFKFLDVSAATPDQGILIMHGPSASSRVKEIARSEKESTIPFVGLMITDYSFHHHIDILGAVLQLSPNLEDEKNCNGNQDHWVYYSSAAIEGATGMVAEAAGSSGNAALATLGGGGGPVSALGTGRQKVLFWYE